MRLYVSILAVAALSTAACGKKAPEPAKPEPAKTEEPVKEPAKDPAAEAPKDPVKDPAAEAPKDPVKDPAAEAPKDPQPVAAADRTEAVQKAFAAFSAGNIEETYAGFADDATLHMVGDVQAPELKGRQAIIDSAKKMREGASDVQIKAARIIESGNVQVVEYVWTANIKTKGADGAEVVKAVALPGAMWLEYNADGKVATAWQFEDQASVMQQIGAAPGLAADFVAAKLPETTEVIKGEANPAHKTAYEAFGSKLKPDLIDGAIAEHIADDYTMVDDRTGKTLAKADMGPMMKGMFEMFSDMTMTVDKDVSVGEYYVAVVTNKSTYKTGIEGAKADTAVTTHSLEVSRIVDGKFKSYRAYHNGMELMAQLGLVGGAAEKPADPNAAAPEAGADSVGVAECDLYISKMRECMGKLPDAAKGTFEQGMKTAVDTWKQSIAAGGDAAKGALGSACKSTLDAAKQAAGQLCPDVKWE